MNPHPTITELFWHFLPWLEVLFILGAIGAFVGDYIIDPWLERRERRRLDQEYEETQRRR